jgi:hypothetical protein
LRDKDAYHLVVLVSTVLPAPPAALAVFVLEWAKKRAGGGSACYRPEVIALGSVIRDFSPDFTLTPGSTARQRPAGKHARGDG